MSKHTYILIHGAWHTNACWEQIKERLEKEGHEVFSPNLPGHGDNKAEFTTITLKSYLESIMSIIEIAVHPVILVGHSMAGMIISQLAENTPDKIEKLIFVAAFVPDNNESLSIISSKFELPGVLPEMRVNPEKNEIKLNISSETKNLFYNTCSSELAQDAVDSLQPEPLKPFTEAVTISQEKFGKVKKLYIECLQDNAIGINDQRKMYGKISCEVIQLNCDHSPFYSDPDGLIKILIKAPKNVKVCSFS